MMTELFGMLKDFKAKLFYHREHRGKKGLTFIACSSG